MELLLKIKSDLLGQDRGTTTETKCLIKVKTVVWYRKDKTYHKPKTDYFIKGKGNTLVDCEYVLTLTPKKSINGITEEDSGHNYPS